MDNINNTVQNQNEVGHQGQEPDDPWLMQSDIWPLVSELEEFSVSYALPWCKSWPDHYYDIDWIRRAMKNTFASLRNDDKEKVRHEYELFLEHDKFCDWKAMAEPVYYADCYIIDQYGKRVERDGEYVQVLRELRGSNEEEALRQLDTHCYEFIEWG